MENIIGAVLVFAWGVLAGCWLRTRQIKSWPALYGLQRRVPPRDPRLADLFD